METVVTNWEKVYENSTESGGWSYLANIEIRTLKKHIGDFNGVKMIELGSGSGRNSFRLANLGAIVSLLDLSQEVLNRSKSYFDANNVSGNFIQGNIFDIPIQDDKFPVVWNAGVIEHWVGDEQVKVIREMLRISSKDGFVITLNPNKSSLHEYIKKILMFFGQYAYTDEENIKTLEFQAQKAGGQLSQKEYSIGFFVLFVGFFIQFKSNKVFGKLAYGIFTVLNNIFTTIDESPLGGFLYQLDKFLCRIFGGYLLVSIIKKKIT